MVRRPSRETPIERLEALRNTHRQQQQRTPAPRSPILVAVSDQPLLLEDLEEEMSHGQPSQAAPQAQQPLNPEAAIQELYQRLHEMQDALTQQAQVITRQNNTIAQQTAQIGAIPRAAPVPRIKPDHPPPFTGRRSESLEAWIFQMQQFCDLAPVPPADRITFAATFFKDQAALWWRAYHQTQDWQAAAPTWDDFLTALCLQFIPINTSISAY